MEEKKIEEVITLYNAFYNEKPSIVVSTGGRFEVLGNHTDHNHGKCLASACSLEIVAAVKENKSKH